MHAYCCKCAKFCGSPNFAPVHYSYYKILLTVFLISRDNNAISDRDVAELGVFAKKLIPKRTQFGPFVAPTTSKAPRPAAGKFLLTVQYKLFLSLCC